MNDEHPNLVAQSEVEQSLRENERRLKTLLSNLPGMAYRCKNDRDWTLEFVSDGCEALTGYLATDLVGVGARTYNSLIHPDDQDQVWTEVQGALKRGLPYRLTYRIVPADGREKWVWEQGVGVYSDDNLEALEGFITDITPQKTAERTLREAEKDYRSIFENAVEGIFRVSPEGKGLAANLALARMLGYQSAAEGMSIVSDVVRQVWLDPSERAKFLHLLETDGIVRNYETQFKRKDGTAIWVSVNGRKVCGADGQKLYTEGFVEDITERRQAEKRLQAQGKRLQDIIEHTEAGYFRIGVDGCFQDVNAAWLRMHGFNRKEDAIGLHFSAVQVPEDLSNAAGVVDALVGGESQKTGEFSRLRRDGTIGYHTFSANTVLEGDRVVGIEGFLVDTTDRRTAELERQQTEQRYRSLFEAMQEGVAIHKLIYSNGVPANYILLEVNRRYEEILGVRREDVVNKLATDAYGTHEVPYLNQFASVVGSGSPFHFETYFAPMDKHFVISVAPMGDDRFATIFFDITDQERTQQAVRQASEAVAAAERHYRLMFNSVSDAVFVHQFDDNGAPSNFLEVNDNACRLLGYTREQLLRMQVVDIIAPEEHFNAPANAKRLMGDGHASWEGRLVAEDGRLVPVEVNARVFTLDGSPTIISSVRDISKRRAAEKAASEAENQYRSIFENALEGMYRTTLQGRSLAANPALAKMLGYDSAHELVMTITDAANQLWLDPNDRSHLFERLNRQGVIRGYECQFKRKDGTPIWVAVNIQMISGSDEHPAYYDGFIQDISERKRADTKLQQANEAIAKAEHKYRHLFNSISDAVFVYELRENGLPTPSKYLEVNDNACRLLGYTRDELLNLQIADLIPPEERFGGPANAQRLVADGQVSWSGSVVSKAGRKIPVEVNTHVLDLDGSSFAISSVRDVTERQESERRYREIFEGAVEGIYRTSIEGRHFLAANSALVKMLGYDSPQELMSTVTDTAHQLWLDPAERMRFATLFDDKGRFQGVECQFKRKDGTPLWVSINAQMSYGVDGRPLYYDGFIQDITERKRADAAIKKASQTIAEAERHYRLMFNSVSDAVVVHQFEEDGLPSRFLEVNDNACRLLGYTRAELLQMGPFDLDVPEDHPDIRDRSQKVLTEGHLLLEGTFVDKDKRRLPVEVNTRLVDLGGLQTIISSVRDITERRRTEAEVRSLVTAIEQTTETVVITDLNGTIQYCNPAFERITGYSKEEAIGQNPRVLKSGKHGKEVYQSLWTTIMQGKVWAGRLTNKKKDGSLYEEDATISPIRDASGTISGFVAVKRDVTEQLQLERQLLQAQKLESVGRLAGGVAHDFNNLLTVINGYSGFLLDEMAAQDPLRSYADEIKIAGERAASLTKQLLAFSRKQIIEKRAVDINTTIRESAPMLQRLIGEDIALETHLDDSLGQVLSDPDQIHQVLMNLAVNARDAMVDGGRLAIETTNVEIDAAVSTLIQDSAVPGRYVLLTVSDTGGGMDETTRQHIFEPFFTTKEVGKGTGLGLSTVYGIVRQSGGWIDVWSPVGVGTSFKIFLPRIEGCSAREGDESGTVTENGAETILVVEDQRSVLDFTGAALRRFGYHVLEASNGVEGIAVAEGYSGQIDLLLTDVVMPGMNGKELAHRLKELRPDLRVLFISGYTADVIAHRGVLDPGVAFLHKPFSPDELAAKIRETLTAH